MAEPLFNPDKCDVASVQSVDFDFVSDCSIAAPPPPIFDCPLPVIPPDPPPPPCPEFQGSLTLAAAFEGCPEVGNEPSGANSMSSGIEIAIQRYFPVFRGFRPLL